MILVSFTQMCHSALMCGSESSDVNGDHVLMPWYVADLEWKLVYVGSSEDESYDQVLESVLVGPVNIGKYRFVFEVILINLRC